MTPLETITIDGVIAACNGGGGPLGHPRVYLNLAPAGRVECPYCSRLYVNRAMPAARGTSGSPGDLDGATGIAAPADTEGPPDPAVRAGESGPAPGPPLE